MGLTKLTAENMSLRTVGVLTLMLMTSAVLADLAEDLSLYRSALRPPLPKRHFRRLGCLGVFDKNSMTKLNLICSQCYELYQEPELHGLCRKDCFTSKYFIGCLEALLLTEQQTEMMQHVRLLSGGE
uniref:CHH larval type n=1 Tax=Parasacculina yatsui TaxID=2836420 RepID=A0A482KFI7_9CRUS|nr:CHH larval type [Parasacculina yatsui]